MSGLPYMVQATTLNTSFILKMEAKCMFGTRGSQFIGRLKEGMFGRQGLSCDKDNSPGWKVVSANILCPGINSLFNVNFLYKCRFLL